MIKRGFVPKAGIVNFALSVMTVLIAMLQSEPKRMLLDIFLGAKELIVIAIGFAAFFYTIYALFRHKDTSRDLEAVLFIWMIICNGIGAIGAFAFMIETGLSLFIFIPVMNVIIALAYVVDLVHDEPADLGEIDWPTSIQTGAAAGVITIVSLAFVWAGVPWQLILCISMAYASFGHERLLIPAPKH
jgi:hypothetical protein